MDDMTTLNHKFATIICTDQSKELILLLVMLNAYFLVFIVTRLLVMSEIQGGTSVKRQYMKKDSLQSF